VRNVKTCSSCGLVTDSGDLVCPVCGHRLPINWNISEMKLRKAGLTVLIPVLVWFAMSALFS
jgi:hypothetical protein